MENEMMEQSQEQGRTFTQTEVDAILANRLKKEREKYGDYAELKEKAGRLDAIEEANKTELQKSQERSAALQKELDELKLAVQLRGMRDAIAAETGVPAALLTADTEDGCRSQAQAVLTFANTNKTPAYPYVRDSGEVKTDIKSGTPKQQFEEWAREALS